MKDKILVTGGSGFIGTNLIETLITRGFDVINIDWNKPKIKEHEVFWKNVDIQDYAKFRKVVLEFSPKYIVHLAARTDLDGKNVNDYSQNIYGVRNLMKITSELSELKKVIITSSKFVTKNGYQIKNQFDYCPHTKYGESKVKTENEVWANPPHCDWCIIRPTSIWGPWFGVPYRNFFDMVRKRMYFHIGKIKCYKTYGFVGNAVHQILGLLFTETPVREEKVFYIGDTPAYEINEWADEIASELGFTIPTAPVWFVKALAKFGDFLFKFGIHFPMQSFRFGNMTNDGKNDLSLTKKYVPESNYSRLEGTKITLEWLKSSNQK